MTEPVNDITVLPDEPWFIGQEALVGDQDQWGFPVAVNDRLFLVDTTQQQFTRRSVQLLNTQNQDSPTGDIASLPPEVWRRNMESWHLGAGQGRFDRKDSIPHRFEDSRHVDPWQEFGFSLLPETTLLQAIPTPDVKTHMLVVDNDWLFAVTGNEGAWWPTLDPAQSVDFALAHDVVDVTSDGSLAYLLLANGDVVSMAPGSGTPVLKAAVPLSDPARGMIAQVKGFLVVGAQNALVNVTSGTSTTIYTHPNPNVTWRDGCDGLNVGYLLGGTGDKWAAYRIGINQQATNLEPPVVAATLPDGEIGYAIASYLGYVLIGLNTGWRFGMPDGQGNLTFGALIDTTSPVECFEGQDKFVWYGLSEGITAQQKAIGDASGLGRADLSNFVAPMTPAFARDLDGGSGVTGRVSAVVTYGAGPLRAGKRLFAVVGHGIYMEADTLCPEGWLTQGWMSFGTADRKRGMYLMGFHTPLEGSIAVDVNRDATAWVQVGFDDFNGSITMGNMEQREAFNAVNVRYRLKRSAVNAKVGPRFTRLEYRCIPIVGTTTEWTIPLLLADTVEWGGAVQGRDVFEDYEYLVGLVKNRSRFIYREGQRRWILYAMDFDWRPSHLTKAGDTFQGVFNLVAREAS